MLIFLGFILLIWIIAFKTPLVGIVASRIFNPLPPEHISSNLPGLFAKELKDQNALWCISQVNVIPMTSDTILYNHNVYLEDGVIHSIVQADLDTEIDKRFTKINGLGKYLIPGLSDMHSHINDDNNLLLMICNGITTTRNMAGFPFHLEMKTSLQNGEILGPHLVSTGPILEGPHQIWRNSLGSIKIRSNDEISDILSKIKSDKFDFIKVYHTLDPLYYKEILKQAKLVEMHTMGHIPLDLGFEEFLEMDQYAIEHIDPRQLRMISPEISLDEKAAKIGKSGKWICPTLIVYDKMNKTRGSLELPVEYEQYVDPLTLKFWNARLNNRDNEYGLRQHMVKIIYDNRGKFLTGTDCINAYVLPGFSLHEELVEMVDCGLPVYDVLKASTINAAEFLGLSNSSGTIEQGKLADLVLLGRNPLESISNTNSISGVMIHGKWMDRDFINKILSKVRESYSSK